MYACIMSGYLFLGVLELGLLLLDALHEHLAHLVLLLLQLRQVRAALLLERLLERHLPDVIIVAIIV